MATEKELRDSAIVTYGDAALTVAIDALEEVGLPGGLLKLENVVECGHVKETAYKWIKQKKEIKPLFKIAGRQVSYGLKIKGYLEKNRLKSLTGVKAKEIFLWAPIGDISVNDVNPGKIAFKSVGGLGKAFPVEAFARGE